MFHHRSSVLVLTLLVAAAPLVDLVARPAEGAAPADVFLVQGRHSFTILGPCMKESFTHASSTPFAGADFLDCAQGQADGVWGFTHTSIDASWDAQRFQPTSCCSGDGSLYAELRIPLDGRARVAVEFEAVGSGPIGSAPGLVFSAAGGRVSFYSQMCVPEVFEVVGPSWGDLTDDSTCADWTVRGGITSCAVPDIALVMALGHQLVSSSRGSIRGGIRVTSVLPDDPSCPRETPCVNTVNSPAIRCDRIANRLYQTLEDTPLVSALPPADPLGATNAYALVEEPNDGAISLAPDGTFLFVPAPNFHGKSYFTVDATTAGATRRETVLVTVLPVNDPPVAVADFGPQLLDGRASFDIDAPDDIVSYDWSLGGSGPLVPLPFPAGRDVCGTLTVTDVAGATDDDAFCLPEAEARSKGAVVMLDDAPLVETAGAARDSVGLDREAFAREQLADVTLLAFDEMAEIGWEADAIVSRARTQIARAELLGGALVLEGIDVEARATWDPFAEVATSDQRATVARITYAGMPIAVGPLEEVRTIELPGGAVLSLFVASVDQSPEGVTRGLDAVRLSVPGGAIVVIGQAIAQAGSDAMEAL